jgi:DNA-binding transcriptional MocR family regulator
MGAVTNWLDRVTPDGGPIYLAVAAALETAIRSGDLQPGERLPPQREVAARLGIDLTTVTRAYNAARERGLTDGAPGRGTFVRLLTPEDDDGRVDLSMNLAPPPEGMALGTLLSDAIGDILARNDASALLAYHPGAGSSAQRAAGAAWLRSTVGDLGAERVLVCPGAQTGIAAALSVVCRPGDGVVGASLGYPGFRDVALRLGLQTLPCTADFEGPTPEALDRLCAERRPRALYLNPTMHNPTTATMSQARREEILRLAAKHDLWVIEDDPYSRLTPGAPPAFAALAPERTFHIATLAKCLTPGLRIGFMVCPSRFVDAACQALRAFAQMPAPLMAAVAAAWIRDGVADDLLAAVRREAIARRALAAQALPSAAGPPESLHIWLPLTDARASARLLAAAQGQNLSLVTAEAFALGAAYPEGVRIALGGPVRRSILAGALARVAALADDGSAPGRGVV